MGLDNYNRIRNFAKSGEPKTGLTAKNLNRFVIQEHKARNLHYDFRLEVNDGKSGGVVLKSWAVPKNVPFEAGPKRLAIQTEDHPVDYLNFSGIIPAGNYGAGEVKVWDKGKWEVIAGGFVSGRLVFKLKGKILSGEYIIIKTKGYGDSKESDKHWLIWKIK